MEPKQSKGNQNHSAQRKAPTSGSSESGQATEKDGNNVSKETKLNKSLDPNTEVGVPQMDKKEDVPSTLQKLGSFQETPKEKKLQRKRKPKQAKKVRSISPFSNQATVMLYSAFLIL